MFYSKLRKQFFLVLILYRAFAQAMEVIPNTLAENAGLNPIQTVTELRNRHAAGETTAGINVRKVKNQNIHEPSRVVEPRQIQLRARTLFCKVGQMFYISFTRLFNCALTRTIDHW